MVGRGLRCSEQLTRHGDVAGGRLLQDITAFRTGWSELTISQCSRMIQGTDATSVYRQTFSTSIHGINMAPLGSRGEVHD